MKRIVVVSVIVVLLLLVFIWWYGRMATYPLGVNNGESYGGAGIMTLTRKGQYAINPVGEAPFFVEDSYQASKYEGTDSEIIPIPEREELVYAVGKVRGWEKIEGSSDLYLVLYHPEQRRTEKYRVMLERGGLFGEKTTLLLTEKVWGWGENMRISVTPYKIKTAMELGEVGIKKLLWRGDVG